MTKRKPLLKIFIGTLTMSILLMVFCLPTMALEPTQRVYYNNKLFRDTTNVYPREYYRITNTFSWKTKSAYTGGAGVNVEPIEELYGEDFGYFIAQYASGGTQLPAKKLQIYAINGEYQKEISLNRQIIRVNNNTEENRFFHPGNQQITASPIEYFWIYTVIIADRDSIKSIPSAGKFSTDVEVDVCYLENQEEVIVRENIERRYDRPANTSIEILYSEDLNEEKYGNNQVIIALTTQIRLNYEYILQKSDEALQSYQWLRSFYIDYGDNLRFLTEEKDADFEITTQQFGSSTQPQLLNAAGQSEEIKNIGDIFWTEEDQIKTNFNDVNTEEAYETIDDVIDSRAFATVSNIYHTLWEFEYLELIMILVVSFALISFVLFGKKG